MTLLFDRAPIARNGSRPVPIYPPFLDVKPEDDQSEAQLVRRKDCASGYAYIETVGEPDSNGKLIIGTGVSLTAYVNRIYLVGCYLYGDLWNINPNSDTIIFTVGVTTYTATLPHGNYDFELLDIITAALNSVGSSVTFSYVVSPQDHDSYIIVGTSPYQIIGGNLVGRPYLANIPIMSVPSTTVTLWAFQPYYTRWIDVNSEVLTSYSKIRNSATSQVSPTNIFRIYDLPSQSAIAISDIPQIQAAVTYLPTVNTSYIDISLLDEFGTPLYIYPGSNLSIVLNFILEQ